MTFQVGDIVRLKTGNAPQRVRHINHDRQAISTVYLSALRHDETAPCAYYDRSERDYVLLESAKSETCPKEDCMPHQTTLFQTKEEKPRYGHYIATNPEGRVVLAMDTGYEDFDEKDLEEVVPHTVEIQFTTGKTYHYAIPADKLKVDDIVVLGVNLGLVKRVNTKNRAPIRNRKTSKNWPPCL